MRPRLHDPPRPPSPPPIRHDDAWPFAAVAHAQRRLTVPAPGRWLMCVPLGAPRWVSASIESWAHDVPQPLVEGVFGLLAPTSAFTATSLANGHLHYLVGPLPDEFQRGAVDPVLQGFHWPDGRVAAAPAAGRAQVPTAFGDPAMDSALMDRWKASIEALRTMMEQTRDPLRLAIEQYLRSTPPARTSVRGLATRLGCSAGHLSRSCRRRLGCSPKALMCDWHARQAARLVRGTPWSLAEIADATGFCDQSHMTHALARHLGDTPGRLRRALGQAPADGAPR